MEFEPCSSRWNKHVAILKPEFFVPEMLIDPIAYRLAEHLPFSFGQPLALVDFIGRLDIHAIFMTHGTHARRKMIVGAKLTVKASEDRAKSRAIEQRQSHHTDDC